ncbi:ATP-binding protein [Sorangium sp. So ce426]|uniref:ATP-binding protein n=1 Tax=Sorangium sp. So ce426 TaxID=3133312 RepID=UPI003F5B20B1
MAPGPYAPADGDEQRHEPRGGRQRPGARQGCRPHDLGAGHATGRRGARAGALTRLLGWLAKIDVLVLDDWGLAPLEDQERRDLLEVFEDRHGLRSTDITSQIPVGTWHDHFGDPRIADAVLDRIAHNAHRVALKGPSRRKGKETTET